MQFEPYYTPTIMDGPVIRWGGGILRGTYREIVSGKEREDWSGEISASRNGVLISGHWPTFDRAEDIAAFTDCLQRAFAAHQELYRARDSDHEVAKAIVAREQQRENSQ